MRKIKILLICEQPLPSKKRAGRPNYSVKYLSELGNEVTVICIPYFRGGRFLTKIHEENLTKGE